MAPNWRGHEQEGDWWDDTIGVGQVGNQRFTDHSKWFARKQIAERVRRERADQEAERQRRQRERDEQAAWRRQAEEAEHQRKQQERDEQAARRQEQEREADEAQQRSVLATARVRDEVYRWANPASAEQVHRAGVPDWDAIARNMAPVISSAPRSPVAPAKIDRREVEQLASCPGRLAPAAFAQACAPGVVRIENQDFDVSAWPAAMHATVDALGASLRATIEPGQPKPESAWTEEERREQAKWLSRAMGRPPVWTQADVDGVAAAERARIAEEQRNTEQRFRDAAIFAYYSALAPVLANLEYGARAAEGLHAEVHDIRRLRGMQHAEQRARYEQARKKHEDAVRNREAVLEQIMTTQLKPFIELIRSGDPETVSGVLAAAAFKALRGYSDRLDQVVAIWEPQTGRAVVDVVLPKLTVPRVTSVRVSTDGTQSGRHEASDDEAKTLERSAIKGLALRVLAEAYARDWYGRVGSMVVNVWQGGARIGDQLRGCACRISLEGDREEAAAVGQDVDALLRALDARVESGGRPVTPIATNLEGAGDITLDSARLKPYVALFEYASSTESSPARPFATEPSTAVGRVAQAWDERPRGEASPPLWWMSPGGK